MGSFEDSLVGEEDATWIGNTMLPAKQSVFTDIMKYGVVIEFCFDIIWQKRKIGFFMDVGSGDYRR